MLCPFMQCCKRWFWQSRTQKHEDLIEWLIKIGSNQNGLVLDLFAGSATTPRVAKRLERNFMGVEDDSLYVRKSRNILKGAE